MNEGLSPVYQWYNGSSPVGSNSSTFTYAPSNGDAVSVVLTSSETCKSGSLATSNTVTMTVNDILPVSVTITADANPVCAGTSVTFTTAPVNEGLSPVFQWYNGSSPVGTNSSTFTYAPLSGDAISVVLTSSETCKSGSPATSNTVTMTVNDILPVSVTITADANPVCAGTSVTFTAAPVNEGLSPVYQWYNGSSPVGSNSSTFTYAPSNGDAVSVELTSSETCKSGSPATSNTVTMTVNDILPVSVTIAASANPVCAGTSVTFTATPVNEGLSPVYQWYNGSSPVGTNSSTFTYTPSNGEAISVELTSSETCKSGSPATSNTVTMTVNDILPVSVNITAGANPICAGTSVTFTAAPVNEGLSPVYQWYNDSSPVGSNSSTFSYTPSNGDVISVELTSSEACKSGSPATSNTITMTVNDILPVSVTVVASANPVCAGTSVTFTATPANGGLSPVYQWFNGSSPVGTNSSTFTYTPLHGDAISVVLTSSEACKSGSPATSNTVTMTVNAYPSITNMTITTGSDTPFSATPVDIINGTVPSGTRYSWSSPLQESGISGGEAGTNEINISGALHNSKNVSKTATYTITPKNATCTGTNFSLTVTVYAKPSISNKSITICSGNTFTVSPVEGVDGDVVPTGTRYTWSAPSVPTEVTGRASGTDALNISGTLTNNSATVQTVIYTVTPRMVLKRVLISL